MFRLRDYQKKCVEAIQSEFEDNDMQLIQLPTGSGKTVILWHYLKTVPDRAIIVAPTKELTYQIYETGCQVVNPNDIYLKKTSFIANRKYIITTMQGLTWMAKYNPEKLPKFDTLIIDEAHRAQAKSYKGFIDKHISGTPRKCLGLTATPERLDGKNLLDIFGSISFSRTLIDLIEHNYLTDIMCYKVRTNTKMTNPILFGGDFNRRSLNQLDLPRRNGIIIDLVTTQLKNKKTLVFCLSVNHARATAKLLRSKGVKAASIDGTLTMTQRKDILHRFKTGDIMVLTNCQLLTEGFDEPSIQALILARPTKSKSLYCQMIGRGVRPFRGKHHCILYDMVDENYNITSFNALGDIPDERVREAYDSGISFLKMSLRDEPDCMEIEETEYDIEEHFLYKKSYEMEALPHQKELLKRYNIPFMDKGFTVTEAAYLLWKRRKAIEYGIDY